MPVLNGGIPLLERHKAVLFYVLNSISLPEMKKGDSFIQFYIRPEQTANLPSG